MKPAYEEFIDTYEIPLLYGFIGTDWFASVDEVKKAYRKAVKKYHPDINEEHKSGYMMSLLNASYEILIDPQKKAEYDAFLRSDEFRDRLAALSGNSSAGEPNTPPPRPKGNNSHDGHTYDESEYQYDFNFKYGPTDEEEEDPPDVYDGEESFFGITGPMGCFLRYIYQYGGVVGAAGVLNWLCMKIFHCGIWDIFFR